MRQPAPGAEGLPAHRWQVPTVRAHVGGEVSTALTLTTGAARGIDVTGWSEAVVTRRGSLTVVASSVLATSTLGLSMHVAPRRSGRWAVTVMSFDSCDPALGSTLRPGRYEIRMNVRIDGRIALTPAIPLTIVA